MAMKMATVEILIEKARFEPQTAVAVAEAIDEAMDRKVSEGQLLTVSAFEAKLDTKLATFVTVAVFEARLAELRADVRGWLADVRSEMRHHIYATFATQVVLLLGILYFLFNHAK